MNEKYHIAASKGRKEVKLEPGNLVWPHLRKERFHASFPDNPSGKSGWLDASPHEGE
jgi:hypothetical protein